MSVAIERIAIVTLAFAVSLLTIIGLMSIWQWIDSDVLYKSLSTIGVIGLAALIIIGISRVVRQYSAPVVVSAPSAAWTSMRNIMLGIVGDVFLIFAALSIASIWDFVGGDVLGKSAYSMMLLFASTVILLAAFQSQSK